MARDRTDNSPASQLVTRLNTMVSQLMGENRKLRREVERLSQRATAAKRTRAVKPVTRAARRPAKKAVAAPRRARKTVTAKGRKTKTPSRRGRR